MSADRRAAAVVIAALAAGVAVWAVGRLRPGVDGELARRGGVVVPVIFDREAAVDRHLARLARALDPRASVERIGGAPALATPPGVDPGPGFLPPRALPDGRQAHRPTPDRAERWRKRAFNQLAERLDARLEDLPAGRGQVTLPTRDAMRLELTPDVDPGWIDAVLAPGELTLWRGGARVADGLDVVRAELRGGRLIVRVRGAPKLAPGPLEARLDGRPLATGPADADPLELTVLDTLDRTARARAAMTLAHGPLPLPARAGPRRRLEPGR